MLDPLMATAGARALTADRIFDGEKVKENHAVVVEGRLITDVMPLAALQPGMPLQRYDGCTLIPGLIDTHIHFMRWMGPVFLAYGVTAVRDTGNDLQWILTCRAHAGEQPWPHIVCLGPLLDGTPPNHAEVARAITDTATAIAAVCETAAAGVDGIKLYASIAAEWIEPMVRASHEAGLKVSMHCLPHGVLAAGRAGVDEFYHLDGILADVWPDRPPGWLNVWGDQNFAATWDRQQQVADEIADLGMMSTPTLAYWDSQWRVRSVGAYEEERQYMPADLFRWAAATPDAELGQTWQRALEAAQKFQGLLLDRQVRVLAGSDTPCGGILPGQSLWRELALLVDTGLSPMEALRAATSEAADFLSRPELGRVQQGRTADLAVVRGDLTRTIPACPDVQLVVKDGVSYEPDELLHAAKVVDPSWRKDPWGRQFALHWAKRMEKA